MKNKLIAMQGGLDLVAPVMTRPDGHIVESLNYEPDVRGYKRLNGFERFDGRPKPSEASYQQLLFTGGTVAITAGQSIVGATTGTTATVLANATVTSGSYGEGDAAGRLALVDVVGAFVVGETLLVSSSPVAVAGAQTLGGIATHIQQAIEARRAVIQPVPGSGPVRGVWEYKGDIYAFRDNADASQCVMYKATTSGWEPVSAPSRMPFSNGGAYVLSFDMTQSWANTGYTNVVTPQVGDTINQTFYGTTVWMSGVISAVINPTWWSGTIEQIVIDSGSFADKNAVGKIVVRITDLPVANYPNVGAHFNLPGYFLPSTDEKPMTGKMFAYVTNVDLLDLKMYDVITGKTTDAEACVLRVIIDSGSFADNNAVGELIIDELVGTFSDEAVIVGAPYAYLNKRYFADVAGSEFANSLLPAGGRYDFVNYNFLGSSTAILSESIPPSVLTFDLFSEDEV
jgi:hypothetical protein